MKTYKNLHHHITSWENLIEAARRASLGKRYSRNVITFNKHLQDNLAQLKYELEKGTYQPGPYAEFYIYESKKRKISAAPFRDRVVHHALCNIIMPIFEKTFVNTSFANRKGKGTHKEVNVNKRYMKKGTGLAKYRIDLHPGDKSMPVHRDGREGRRLNVISNALSRLFTSSLDSGQV